MVEQNDYYKEFLWSCFDNSFGATRAGIDSDVISKFTPIEKEEVEAMVLQRLPTTNDLRPFIVAGMMRLGKAVPLLKERLANGIPEEDEILKVQIAHTLFLIDNWLEAVEIITSVLLNTPNTEFRRFAREDAVKALADFGKNAYTLQILFETIEDEDSFIGWLATNSLKKIYSKERKIEILLEKMHKAQIKPVRQKPEFIEKRRLLFRKLEKLTNIRMPLS